MTSRINAVTVVLKDDIRDDDMASIINALLMVKGVLSAERNVADIGDYVAEQRAKHKLQEALWKALESQ